jgi:hypothetical protein
MQNSKIKEKAKQTCLKKFGVEYPVQNTEFMEKVSKNSFKLKEYTLPSGNIIKLQGYENFAMNELLQLYKEEEIKTGCTNVPIIWYIDDNNKKHRHYVDIYIPECKKCIEVKSTWTAEKKKDNIFIKQQAAKELGFEYEIWIYNYKGLKIECYK